MGKATLDDVTSEQRVEKLADQCQTPPYAGFVLVVDADLQGAEGDGERVQVSRRRNVPAVGAP